MGNRINKDWLTVEDVMNELDLKERKAYYLMRTLRARKIDGRTLRLSRRSLDEYLEGTDE